GWAQGLAQGNRRSSWPVVKDVGAALFLLTELAVEQGADVLQRAIRVLALRIDGNRHPQSGSQHHDPHDALGVDALIATRDVNIALIASGELSELGGGTRM